nr:MAG TPA: hypothetical protein [Caudoviricetes sp.]
MSLAIFNSYLRMNLIFYKYYSILSIKSQIIENHLLSNEDLYK